MSRINYTASGRLAVWDHIVSEHRYHFLNNLTELLRNHSNASIEALDFELHEPNDSNSVALTAILDKYVSRGCPTYVSYDFEERLLDFAELAGFQTMDLAEINRHLLGRMIVGLPDGQNYDGFIQVAHRQLYYRYSENLTEHQVNLPLPHRFEDITSEEENIFYRKFGEKFSRALQALLQRQTLITDLIGEDNPQVVDSRVDFSFSLHKLKWIFEIDGEQHREEEELQRDITRDEILSNAGWIVFRIPARVVRDDLDNWFTADFIANLNPDEGDLLERIRKTISTSRLEDEIDSPSFMTILLPHYVHRCLRGLIQIFRMASIEIDKPLKILAIEEDLILLPEAFYQLLKIWQNLRILAPEIPAPTEIELQVVGGRPFIDVPTIEGFNIQYIDDSNSIYDLIISNSATLFSGQKGLKQNEMMSRAAGKCIAIRTAPIHREYRNLQWSPPLKFDLEDLEETIVSLDKDKEATPSQKIDHLRQFPKYNALKFFLQDAFRKREFWEGQARVISRLLMDKHSIVLLPTGGGKSLTYQFAGLLKPGMSIIIDPLIALMNDQVENLNNMGFDRAGFISSLLEPDERQTALKDMENGLMYYIFIAPERMQMEEFRNSLQSVVYNIPISLAVIDEAHCVSEWGHDFRPSYLHLSRNIRRYCTAEGGESPPLVALTGTASFAVLTDIQMELNINEENAIILPRSFDREELHFHVEQVDTNQKSARLSIIKMNLPRTFNRNPQAFFIHHGDETNSGIIFCPYVNGPFGVYEISDHNNYYSGAKPKRVNMDYNEWKEYKTEIQRRFKYNEIQEVVATKALGMGIDKPNIRYTIHYSIPNSVEAFYQEAGRAGRDGENAHCFIIYSDDNWDTAMEILGENNHITAMERLNSINRNDRGDILLQLWLLLNTYQSRDVEKEYTYDFWINGLAPAVNNLNIGGTNTVEVPFGRDSERSQKEKAIFRLILLGAVEEYSVNWNRNRRNFGVTVRQIAPQEVKYKLREYIKQYKFEQIADEYTIGMPEDTVEDALQFAISKIIDFVYDEIVIKRKHALRSIAEYCRDFNNDQIFRANILSYLQESEFSEILRGWINQPFDQIGIYVIMNILNNIEDLEQARRLLGTCRRMLDEDPSNIALRLLSSCARARSNAESDDSTKQEIIFLINQISEQYQSLNNPESILLKLIEKIISHREVLFQEILDYILCRIGSREFVREYLEIIDKFPDSTNYNNMMKILAAEALRQTKTSNFYTSLTERRN